jgi:hypothetical protein
MIQAVRSFMDEEITSDQFDGVLAEIGDTASDESVRTLRRALWGCYDDLKDHLIVADKQRWDFLNRVLLLLASDSEIEFETTWATWWHARQVIAAVAVASYAFLAARSRFAGEDLVLLAFPFCLVSMALAWSNKWRHSTQKREAAVEPFPSVRTLSSVRRSVKSFVRRRYPKELAGRRVRDRVTSALLWLPLVPVWVMFAPIALLVQALPETETRFAFSKSGDVALQKPA